MIQSKNNNHFYHLIDLRLTLNLSNDNRFSYKAPIITSVTPTRGPVSGNQKIQIFGYNFGRSILDIKEILVRGVICKNIEFTSSNILSCYSGNSLIMGAGPGNVVVKLLCGLSSPTNTCNMYEYNAKMADIPSMEDIDSSQNNNNYNNSNSIKVVNVNFPPPGIMVAHSISPVFPVRNVIRSIHSIRPAPILPLFSFKEKNNLSKKDNNDDAILDSLKDKMQKYDFEKKETKNKVDNLVTDNFKNIVSYAENNGFGNSKDGFRKKRFRSLVDQLK